VPESDRPLAGPLAAMGRAMQRVGVKHKIPDLVAAGLKAQAEAAAKSVQESAGLDGRPGGGEAGDG
jgi:hypothetical protein